MLRFFLKVLDKNKFLGGGRPWLVILVVFLGRMIWYGHWNVLLEVDSLGYLTPQAALYHPPGYTAFCSVTMAVTQSLGMIVVAQSLAYAAAAGLLLWAWIPAGRWRLLLAVGLALEPLSGMLACTIMAETLFLALLFCSLAALKWLLQAEESRRWQAAAVMGLLLGGAEWVRYAAPAFTVGIGLWLLWRHRNDRKMWLAVAVMAVASRLALLPVHIYYKARFDTWSINAFSAISRWNSAAYLYPGSAVQSAPDGEWEEFLATIPDEKFSLEETWHTNQMFHDSCAFQRYVRGRTTAEVMRASAEAGRTARRLLLASPIRHISSFILPNIQRPFTKTDLIISNRLWHELPGQERYHDWDLHVYNPSRWWICFFGLMAATLLAYFRPGQGPTVLEPILVCLWLYLAGIAVLSVVFLRFVYVLAPLILLALSMQFVRSQASNPASEGR